MVRPPCGEDTSKLTKGPWAKEEDKKLSKYIRENGHENWRTVAEQAGLNRCGKSCRLRWINYLRPDIKRGNITEDELRLIVKLHSEYGNSWSKIASHLPGRTDNEIKNYWNTHMRKKQHRDIVNSMMINQPLLNPNQVTNLSLLNLMANPIWNHPFYQFPLNFMQMTNQNALYPANFILANAFDPINQLQLSQSLMQMINPNPSPNSFNSFAETSCQTEEHLHGFNNNVGDPQIVNTLPSSSNPMTSFESDVEPHELTNMCYNDLITDYIIPTNESSLPNLVSVETPSIVYQVESNFSPIPSASSIIFEDLDKFLNDDAYVI